MIEILFSMLLFHNAVELLPTTPKQAIEHLESHGIEANLRDEGGFSFFAPGLLFESGSDKVTSTANAKMDAIIDVLQMKGIHDDIVYFEGHTDHFGSDEYNMDLGYRRAKNVSKIYMSKGLKSGRILINSKGENYPISDNPSENRRVEMVVIDVKFLD